MFLLTQFVCVWPTRGAALDLCPFQATSALQPKTSAELASAEVELRRRDLAMALRLKFVPIPNHEAVNGSRQGLGGSWGKRDWNLGGIEFVALASSQWKISFPNSFGESECTELRYARFTFSFIVNE